MRRESENKTKARHLGRIAGFGRRPRPRIGTASAVTPEWVDLVDDLPTIPYSSTPSPAWTTSC